MGLKISGLNELREHLERLRPEEVMAQALAEQAARMAERAREGLSEQPGAAGHDELWLRSGALRDSVGAEADGLQAVVGSSDPGSRAGGDGHGAHASPPIPGASGGGHGRGGSLGGGGADGGGVAGRGAGGGGGCACGLGDRPGQR